MPKINGYTIPNEIKKPIETVYELKGNEYKVPSFEEFMKDYQVNENVVESYANEAKSYDNIGIKKVGGPMYGGGSNFNNIFFIDYSFDNESGDCKLFFEKFGVYTTKLEISGDLWKLRDEPRKLENGEIRVINLVLGRYERDRDYEESIKDDLREDIGEFEEMVRSGRVKYNGIGREYYREKQIKFVNLSNF